MSLAQAEVLVTHHGQTARPVEEKHLNTSVITLDTPFYLSDPVLCQLWAYMK